MIIICAWCKKIIGRKYGKGITHIICDECFEKENKKLDNKIKED